jgi:hypothetical protein
MSWNEIAEETLLLFFDEKSKYDLPNTQQKIAKELFKDVNLIQSLADLKSIISKQKEDQQILFFIHLNHNENNKGLDNFKVSKIKIEYPNLRIHYISSVPKKTIFQDGNDVLDVFSYDSFHDKIGETFIPQTVLEIISQNKISEILKKGIFLSHSTKDAMIVGKFRELILELGLNYDSKLIKLTSSEEYGIPAGADIPEDLEQFLKNDMGLFIQFLTPNYIESRVCLNEEGAGWCLLDDKKFFIPIIIPPHTHSLLSWIKNTDKGIKINDKSSLSNVYQHRKKFFGSDVDITRLQQKIEEFIQYVDDEIEKTTKAKHYKKANFAKS